MQWANVVDPPAGNGGADVLPQKHQPCRLAGLGATPLGVGGFGETADGSGFVVVDVKDRIEFRNL
jgi:hypothetical protein